MWLISRKPLREFWHKHPNAEQALRLWETRIKVASWDSIHDAQKAFSDVEALGKHRLVFNIKGNHYRLITKVNYKAKKVFVIWIGSHKEYDKIDAETIDYKK